MGADTAAISCWPEWGGANTLLLACQTTQVIMTLLLTTAQGRSSLGWPLLPAVPKIPAHGQPPRGTWGDAYSSQMSMPQWPDFSEDMLRKVLLSWQQLSTKNLTYY